MVPAFGLLGTCTGGMPGSGPAFAVFLYGGVVVPREGGGGTANNAATVEGIGRALAWLVLALACAVMAGWIFDVRTLTSVAPGYTTMKFNAASSFLGLSVALLAGSAAVRWLPLLGVALLTSATLVQGWTGWSLGIDELVVEDLGTTGGAAPGRMAPATATALLVLSVAVMVLRTRRNHWVQPILLVPTMIALTALLGYLYDVEQLYRVASLTSVALHTAVGILLSTFAVAAFVPKGLLAWAVRGRGPGAKVVRQTAPVIVFGLAVVGLVRMYLGDNGLFGVHFGIAIMVMAGILISVGVTVFSALRLDVADDQRVEAEESLRKLIESLAAGRDEAWARVENLAAELADERVRFGRAVSGTETVVWTVDTTTGVPEEVYTSPNTERVLGDRLLVDETAITALLRLAADDQKHAAAEVRRCALAGIPVESEVQLAGGDGAKWVRVQGVPRPDGVRTYYDGVVTDTTAQHAVAAQRELLLAQEQLQVERLSELNRLRDEFIAVAGHELRTPVAVILGYCEMLNYPGTTDAARREGATVIARRAHQLSQLVERVFDLATIDSGSVSLNLEPVPMADFVADLVADHQQTADEVGVSLSVDVADTVVLADASRLGQVLDNLVSNALKYTPAGGHVDLVVRDDGDDVVFELADDGIGVEPAELPYLFDRLFRAANARESRILGTGLGLSVTKALVEAHGGTLTVRLNEPRGLVFRVTLAQADVPVAGVDA